VTPADVENGLATRSQVRGGHSVSPTLGRSPSRRNPFPGESFFIVPIALYETGLSSRMSHSQFIRYVTLLRIANYLSTPRFPIDLGTLESLDGISKRAGRDAHTKLQEYGLIRIAKTNPYTYTLVSPAHWEENLSRIRPRFRRDRSLKVELDWVQE
jgi:hypothetical protein